MSKPSPLKRLQLKDLKAAYRSYSSWPKFKHSDC